MLFRSDVFQGQNEYVSDTEWARIMIAKLTEKPLVPNTNIFKNSKDYKEWQDYLIERQKDPRNPFVSLNYIIRQLAKQQSIVENSYMRTEERTNAYGKVNGVVQSPFGSFGGQFSMDQMAVRLISIVQMVAEQQSRDKSKAAVSNFLTNYKYSTSTSEVTASAPDEFANNIPPELQKVLLKSYARMQYSQQGVHLTYDQAYSALMTNTDAAELKGNSFLENEAVMKTNNNYLASQRYVKYLQENGILDDRGNGKYALIVGDDYKFQIGRAHV